MELDCLDISDEGSFESYLTKIRQPNYPYDRFVSMVVNLPRQVARHNLHRATYHADMTVVCEAVDLFSRLFPNESAPRCLELLKHSDAYVRACAIGCLTFIVSECEDAILDLLHSEEDSGVRFAAVEYLAKLGTTKAFPVLEAIQDHDKAVDYEERPIGRAAEAAMRKIGRSPRGTKSP